MPKKPRQTTNPLGRKLLQVLAEQGTPDDLNALARAFDVTVPSTYDWIIHGRFAKERYPRLVEWSGKDLHWWFDVPPLAVAPPTHQRHVAEPAAQYATAWPFRNVPLSAVQQLNPEQLQTLEGALLGVLAIIGPASKKQRAA
jgi:hypothetical protein